MFKPKELSPLKQKHIEREESPRGTGRYMLTLKLSLIMLRSDLKKNK